MYVAADPRADSDVAWIPKQVFSNGDDHGRALWSSSIETNDLTAAAAAAAAEAEI